MRWLTVGAQVCGYKCVNGSDTDLIQYSNRFSWCYYSLSNDSLMAPFGRLGEMGALRDSRREKETALFLLLVSISRGSRCMELLLDKWSRDDFAGQRLNGECSDSFNVLRSIAEFLLLTSCGLSPLLNDEAEESGRRPGKSIGFMDEIDDDWFGVACSMFGVEGYHRLDLRLGLTRKLPSTS